MDLWRTTTPRPLIDVVRTIRQRDENGNTEYRAYIGMVRVSETKEYCLTENENHLAAAMAALSHWKNSRSWVLLDFSVIDEKSGTFVFSRNQ